MSKDKDDLIAGDDRKLIPEGKYSAQCVEAKRGLVGIMTTKGTSSRTRKVILKFNISDGQYAGEEIPMYLNVDYKRIPAGSKFYQCWVIANNGGRPSRRDRNRMSLEVFRNHVFEVGVKTVKGKFGDGREKPSSLWYSRVDEIYEKCA